MTARPSKLNLRGPSVAFGVVVLAAYATYFADPNFEFRLPRVLLMVGLGLVYTVIGLVGSRWVERKLSFARSMPYMLGLMILGGIITYLGGGTMWLLLLPLAGSAVEYLPGPLALAACLVLWGVIVAPFVLVFGTQTAVFWMMPVLAAIVFVAAFTRVMVSEQRARAELVETHRKLRQYAAQVEELAVVQERNRLAREIHDGLGHYLTAIHIQIKAAAASQGQDEDALRGALENAQRLAGEALADVRKSVSALRADPATQRPLAERIENLAAEARSGGLRVDLTQSGAARPLEAQADFALYRAAQEALTNIRKHAQASAVRVELSYRPASVFLAVQDDGVGVSAPESGFGLIGLRERVELLSGTLRVHSAVGQGFCLEVEIPLAAQADSLAE